MLLGESNFLSEVFTGGAFSLIFSTSLDSDVTLIEEGIGEKLGLFVQFTSTFVAGFVVGFFYSWKLSLVILSVAPILGICGAFMGKLMATASTRGQESYAKAGGVAEEVISW